MRFYFSFLLINILCLSSSCTFSTGLARTSFESWNQRQFSHTGLKCDLPKQNIINSGYFVEEYANEKTLKSIGFKTILIKIHPIYHGVALAETGYLINISIQRLDSKKYQKFKGGTFQIGGNGIFREHTDIFHGELNKYVSHAIGIHGYDKDEMLIYRKDYKAPNGDYILCGASINLSSGVSSFPSAEDLNAVKRILESVVPIE